MSKIQFALHERQSLAFKSVATEILYGGAAGGGKSELMRVASIAWCMEIEGLQVYLFRRIREDLHKNHMEGPNGYRAKLAPLVQSGQCEIIEDEIRFSNGSKIYLCHCKDEKDRFKYLGTEMHVLLIDELTMFTEVIYRFLRSRVRMPRMHIPERLQGCFPRILCSTNPGGMGHQWVKTTWIDSKPPMEVWDTPPSEGGFKRQFIPAKLSDNPSLDQAAYSMNLQGLGNEELVRAMLDGDWNVVAGAAFNISNDRHMLRPFKPPQYWTKFTSFDWGYVKPYCCAWYCVAEGNTLLRGNANYPDRYIPDGAVVMYRELYGSTGRPDEGLREESEIVVRKIMEIEKEAGEHIDYRVADTACWSKQDGPSTFERMYEASRDAYGHHHWQPRQSIKDRQASYNEICMRLKGELTERGVYEPMVYVTENCRNWWRTVPSLVLDDKQPEKGPDELQELHSFDQFAYALMSRPMVRTLAGRQEALFHRLRRENNVDGGRDPYRIKKH